MKTQTTESLVITSSVVDSAVALQQSTDPDDYRRTTQTVIAENTPAFTGFECSIYAGLCRLRGLDSADSVRRASLLSMNILMNASNQQKLSPDINQELARSAGIISVAGLLDQTYQQKLQTIFEEDYTESPAVLDLVGKTMDKNTAERFGAKLIFSVFGSLVNYDHKLLSLPKARAAAPKQRSSRQTLLVMSRRK